jgi:hypothetical protein
MIQFVCIREGKGRNTSYRSLTADRITIHPGSVMFRSDPQFIVAGEIVRTSRMYAMSVSPLTQEILKELGLGAKDWGLVTESREQGAEKRERKLKKVRDFTNNIKIATEVFEITTIKGRKTVILPWEKLSSIRDNIPAETVYKGLKGCITYNNNHYSILGGEKLELILSLAPSLDMENALTREWPRKKNFNANTDLAALLEHMDSLVKPVRWKKNSKELGFLSLFTDHEGNYWLRSSRGFHSSLNESLASLESLIVEMSDDVDIDIKHIVNQTYRRLSDQVSG